tara:strand:- start:474 stop:656 length:183 start_codon:yes stop_codon:yes gene_type:complete
METQYITIKVQTNLDTSELLDLVIDMVAPAIIQEVNCFGLACRIDTQQIIVSTTQQMELT